VQSVATSINGIGYSGIGYKTSGVRAVPLKGADGEFHEANEKNALSGKYPLARFLYVYINKAPNKPLRPVDAEFLKLVLSKQGQEIVEKDGYIPLPSSEVKKIRAKLGL
jgi:phosphate transport system substrate-binding protein